MLLIDKIKNLFKNDDLEKFNNILSFAHEVIKTTNENKLRYPQYNYHYHPLIDVVKLLGRTLQTSYMTRLLYLRGEADLASLYPETVLLDSKESITTDGKKFNEIITKLNLEKEIFLHKDLVLPWPWKRSRLIKNISAIGEGRVSGAWKEHEDNHYVELWLPLGVCWVHGGNHSISVGIIQGTGKIKPKNVYDISGIYNYIICDGKNFLRKEDKRVISPVKNIEFAAMFEIGRLMKENNISY